MARVEIPYGSNVINADVEKVIDALIHQGFLVPLYDDSEPEIEGPMFRLSNLLEDRNA